MSPENVEFVAELYRTLSRATWESGEWIARFHPELVYHPRKDEPDTEPFVGRETWARIVAGFWDAFAMITFTVEETIDAGEWAIVSTVLHAQGRASGVEITDRYVFVYKVRDGLVVEGREFGTMAEALEFTGR